jgi:drug/metabolite transporter (DMT)-like permease
MTTDANLRSAGWMMLGIAGYVTNDALIKLAAEDLPLFQAIFLRGCWVCLVLIALNIYQGSLRSLRQHLSKPIALRLVCETLGTICYLSALTRLPLAGLTAVLQVVPLVVVFVAARLLREPVSLQRVSAVLLGFVGVLLVVKPGAASFSGWYFLGFATVVFIVIRELATRRISDSAPTQVVALMTAISITVMGLSLSFFEGWGPMGTGSTLLLLGAGVFLTVGYVASVATVRIGELSFSAPFRYSVIVFSIILQIVVFGEIPDILTFVGSAIVAGAGLWAFWADQPRSASATVGAGRT